MPLSTNPFVSAISNLLTTGNVRSVQPTLSSVYSTSTRSNVLAERASALGAGPNSALNGQTAPAGRARARNQQDQAVQTQVNLPSGAEITPITQTGTAPSTPVSSQRRDIIVEGTGPAGSDKEIGAAATDVRQSARAGNLPNVDIAAVANAAINNFNWGDPETIVRAVPVETGDWRVRIAAPLGLGEILFPVLPTMTLSHKATYSEVGLVHSNYQFLSYKNSQPDDIQITCDWPVETPQDALEWIKMILLGRSVTKMFYGASANLGNPPPICTLKGYGSNRNGVILPDTPVVIKGFSFDLKDDVNYIEFDGNYVPRLSTVTFTCTVIYNRNSQRAFDFVQYRQGNPNTPIRY